MNLPRPLDEDLKGMTVNERLFASGLLEEFDTAALKRDRTKMIDLMMRAAATLEQAEATVDATLADPAKYGY